MRRLRCNLRVRDIRKSASCQDVLARPTRLAVRVGNLQSDATCDSSPSVDPFRDCPDIRQGLRSENEILRGARRRASAELVWIVGVAPSASIVRITGRPARGCAQREQVERDEAIPVRAAFPKGRSVLLFEMKPRAPKVRLVTRCLAHTPARPENTQDNCSVVSWHVP